MNVTKDKKFLRCVIYCRTSDVETMSKDHNSTEQQRNICLSLAKGKSLSTGIEHRVIYDLTEAKAVSGASSERANYKKLIKLIKRGKVDVIFAKELSRLTRNISDFLELLKLCKKHNVCIYMNGLYFEPGDIFSEMIVQIMAVVAQFERSLIIERTRTSIRSRVLNNAVIHGGNVILGFDKVEGKTGVWKINKREQKIILHVMEIFLNSSTYAQAVREIRTFGYKSKTNRDFDREYLTRLLKNKKYIGKLKVPQDKNDDSPSEYVDLPTGPVVPVELFEQVQKKIKSIEESGNSNRRGKNRVYPLSGLVKSESGNVYTGAMGGKKIYYQATKDDARLDAEALENAVINYFRKFEDDKEMASLMREAVNKKSEKLELVDSSIVDIQTEIDELEGELKGLITSLAHIGDSGAVKEVVKTLSEEMNKVTARKNELESRLEGLQTKRDDIRSESLACKPLKEIMKYVFNKLQRASNEVKKAVFNNLIEEIRVLKGNKVEIVWKPEVCGRGGPFFDLGEKWGDRWGSNPRQPESQSGALPTELRSP